MMCFANHAGPRAPSPVSVHVQIILEGGAGIEMRRIAALSIATLVQHPQTIWNCAVDLFVNKPMNHAALFAGRYSPDLGISV